MLPYFLAASFAARGHSYAAGIVSRSRKRARPLVGDDVPFVTFGELSVDGPTERERPTKEMMEPTGEGGLRTVEGALFCSAFVIKPE